MPGEPVSKRHVCPVCGIVFSGPEDRLYCSDKCTNKALRIIKLTRKMEQLESQKQETPKPEIQKPEIQKPARKISCKYCGTKITDPEPGQKYCCASCARLAEMTTPKRHCHDCGKPCVGYRCKACWGRLNSTLDGESAGYGE